MNEDTASNLVDNIRRARKEIIKSWLMHPLRHVVPQDVSFEEINEQLDKLQDRINECRRLYPWKRKADE